MGRSPCCSKVGLRRGPWSAKEDALLSDYILNHGEGQWRSLPNKAGLLRCGKSCRLRWMNYLRPGIKRGNITQDEEDLIVRLHALLGNRWSLIAGRLPGRTDNEVKNYWNTHLLKKLATKTHPKPLKIPKKKKLQENAPLPDPVINAHPPDSTNTTKLYLPKPIRVSPSPPPLSRTTSYDSLSSRTSSCDVAAEPATAAAWTPLLETEDVISYGEDDYFNLGAVGGDILPWLTISGDDIDMLDQVYDDYLQLL